MHPTIATLCVIGIAFALGVAVWALWRTFTRAEGPADKYRANMTAEALAKPDDAYVASVLRFRAIDDEYRQLVLEAHHDE